MMAIDMLLGATDGAPVVHLMVSPRQLFVAKRLVSMIADEKPKSLIGMMSKGGLVEANYAWQDGCGSRWMLIGQDHIVYTCGSGD